MELVPALVIWVPLVVLGSFYLWLVNWAVDDAQQRGETGQFVAYLFYFTGPFGALIWFMLRPSKRLIDRSPDEYKNPDEALSAAAMLDRIGEWNSAIELFQSAADRWPETATYARNSIADIMQKQVMAAE